MFKSFAAEMFNLSFAQKLHFSVNCWLITWAGNKIIFIFNIFRAPGLSANDAMQKLAVLGTMADVGGGGIGKIPLFIKKCLTFKQIDYYELDKNIMNDFGQIDIWI